MINYNPSVHFQEFLIIFIIKINIIRKLLNFKETSLRKFSKYVGKLFWGVLIVLATVLISIPKVMKIILMIESDPINN